MLNVEDHLAILDLYARYTHSIDGGDTEGWCACFTADGSVSMPDSGTVVQGPESLRAFALAFRDNSKGAKKHVTTNITLRLDGEAVAGAAYVMMVVAGPLAACSTVGATGRYEDKVVKDGGQWRFAQRTIHLDVASGSA